MVQNSSSFHVLLGKGFWECPALGILGPGYCFGVLRQVPGGSFEGFWGDLRVSVLRWERVLVSSFRCLVVIRLERLLALFRHRLAPPRPRNSTVSPQAGTRHPRNSTVSPQADAPAPADPPGRRHFTKEYCTIISQQGYGTGSDTPWAVGLAKFPSGCILKRAGRCQGENQARALARA